MVFACNSSNEEVETEGSGIQGHPKLHREFKASLDSVIIPFLKQKKSKFKSNIDELIFLLVQELDDLKCGSGTGVPVVAVTSYCNIPR